MAEQWIDNALNGLAARMRAAGREPLGYRPNGRPIWPIFGASPDDGGDGADGGSTTAGGAGDAGTAGTGGAGGSGSGSDLGFPANTPLEQMTVDQQAAYWKDKARKHEDRVKSFGKLTPEELTALREKAEKHDALELELGSEADKKAAEARKAAAAEADARYQPLLVQAKFESLAAGRIEPDKLATILEPLDLSKFLATDGTPDTDKVKAYVDGIAPAMGTSSGAGRPGPSPSGQGQRPAAGAKSGDPARAWLAKQGIKVD